MYEPTDALTQSKILSFGCPARYEKLHVQGLSDTSDPARRGSTVHTANELYVRALVAQSMVSDPMLAQESLAKAIVLENTPPHLVPECEDLWTRHIERFELNLSAFLEAETRRRVGPYAFKPDLVYALPEALEIIDLKTHYQGLTETAAKADLQARMYAYLASKVWPGFPAYRFSFWFIRLNLQVSVAFEPSELDAIERQLAAHGLAIETAKQGGEYPPAPGAQCSYCSFACPAVDDAMRLPMRITSSTDAALIASDILVMKQTLAAKTKVLDAYCALNGPVVVRDMEFAHRPVESVKFPAAKVVDTLRAMECDVSKIALGKTALRSWLTAKKFAHIAPLLKALGVTSPGTRFTAKKIGAVGDEPEEAGEVSS